MIRHASRVLCSLSVLPARGKSIIFLSAWYPQASSVLPASSDVFLPSPSIDERLSNPLVVLSLRGEGQNLGLSSSLSVVLVLHVKAARKKILKLIFSKRSFLQ